MSGPNGEALTDGQVAEGGWRKSGSCSGGSCVEVLRIGDIVLVRNSTDPTNVLRFTLAEWRAFTRGVDAGEFQYSVR